MRFRRRYVHTCESLLIVVLLGACGDLPVQYQRSLNNTRHGYRVVEDPTDSAPTKRVERFEVRPGDCGSNEAWDDCATDRERSELSERGDRIRAGRTDWYGWSLYLPSDHVSIYPSFVVLGQFHQEGLKPPRPAWTFQHVLGGYTLHDVSMCGVAPTLALLYAARALGVREAELVRHRTSGDASGDYGSVVGYAGLVLR